MQNMFSRKLLDMFWLSAVFALTGCAGGGGDWQQFSLFKAAPSTHEQRPVSEPVNTVKDVKVPLNIRDNQTRDVSLLKATQYNFGSNITIFPLDADVSQAQQNLQSPQRMPTVPFSPFGDPNVQIFPLGNDETPAKLSLQPPAQAVRPRFASPFDAEAELLPPPVSKPFQRRSTFQATQSQSRILTGY